MTTAAETTAPGTTPMLTMTGIGKSFGPVRALDGVTLTVEPSSVHCILGENGAGKSTLCNSIYGTVSPDSGNMTLAGADYRPRNPAEALSAGVAMVHQHFSLIPTMTVADNLLLGRDGFRPPRGRLSADLSRISDKYGLRVDEKAVVGELTVGARQRVEIVKALLRDPRLILLDEPTAVLDPAEIDALIDTCAALTADDKSVVLITHKLGEVARAADEATVLRAGAVVGGGRLSQVSLSTLTELMLGDSAHLQPTPRARTITAGAGGGLSVRGLNLDRPDGSAALANLNLTVERGEIVGIAGVDGNGQSELTAVLSGSLKPDSGQVLVDGEDLSAAPPARRTQSGMAVIPEDRHAEGIIGELTIAENIAMPRLSKYRRWGLLDRTRMRADASAAIADYSIRASGPDAQLRSLSGGNQQKVVLARELSTDGLRVVVAAQPTRGLDAGAVAFVLDRLRTAADDGAAVLITSTEIDELLAVCDRIVVAYRGSLHGSVKADSPTATRDIGVLMMGVSA
ncbi:ABC transporter ATP-binding protein [Mycolicibacterium wolinskyi]|uniref:Sugar ABC transporter n=1 Tax=Mycolicibacterium wolinskyi TaxID=59750 RepID=A0A1X2F8S9_9MYCO|nr:MULTISPECIES: ABC transporter ATP-binding protein [Mycolicibacterium]MCV7286442.1 ABC transporter ATP-binding protein [Mycolicibacterium wolinskyi]MCV7293422.1 ABC transporter ATP-binding protein [Mycolicibacterium goodii]ORX14825.1 sugar ABC transporter [Mycolicibacterium wolinskyi]